MTDFLPKDYELPESERRYMEFAEGTNTFRILTPAIVGYEWWVETHDHGRKPHRVRTAEDVPTEVKNATDVQAKPKHFWAFAVFNYATQSIQVLEIKQQTIMRALEALVNNPKWGNPQLYDLTVEKVKTGTRDLDVEYHVIPEPPSQLDEGIAELAHHVPVRLEALYEGADPFASREAAAQDKRETRKGNGKREPRSTRRVRVYS